MPTRTTRTRIPVVPMLVCAALLAGVPSATASSGPVLAGVGIATQGEQLTVTGSVEFAAVTPAAAWTDPTGDAGQSGIGADARRATLRVEGETIVFGLEIADPLPDPVFTLPEAVHYHWNLLVTSGGVTTPYQVQGMRSGQYQRPTPSPTTLLRVLACDALSSGNPSCHIHKAEVPGQMAGGLIEWRVPASLIGAGTGAKLSVFGNGVIIQPGATGATYASGPRTTLDQVTTAPWFAGPALDFAVTPEFAEPEDDVYARIDPNPEGTFSTSFSTEGLFPGRYEVVLRACQGSACAVVRVPFTVR